jgi:hypothetical protein
MQGSTLLPGFFILRLFKIELEAVWQYVEEFFYLRHVSYSCVLFMTEPLQQYSHSNKIFALHIRMVIPQFLNFSLILTISWILFFQCFLTLPYLYMLIFRNSLFVAECACKMFLFLTVPFVCEYYTVCSGVFGRFLLLHVRIFFIFWFFPYDY